MNDKLRLFDLNKQSPVIQLFTSVSIVIVSGMLLFFLFVLAGSLFLGKDLNGMLSTPASDSGKKEILILKYIQVSQQIGMFLLPAVIISWFLKKGNESFLKADKVPGAVPLLMVVFLAVLILPITGFAGAINEKMILPEWLSGVEGWMRRSEDSASELTGLLISSSKTGELLLNIFVVALIPSVAEEMIFRGVLQQLLCRSLRSDHAGIWMTAILFSAIHFQFFGFLPRLILGLSFGYLYFFSGNLWLSVIAHFVNNLIPVLIAYFTGWSEYIDKAAPQLEGQVVLLIAAILCLWVFLYFHRVYRKNTLKND